jgi:ABC-type transport system substrate-binding protein
VDTSTVKFIFKQPPNVGVWQYGALQGPIVQKAYWEPRINDAVGLLPDDVLRGQVDEARTYFAKVQSNVKNLTAQVALLRLNGQSDRKLEGNLSGAQGELTFAQNSLNKLLEGYTTKIESARQTLYALKTDDEPTLGTWIPEGKQNDAWVNEANPDFPFIKPNFDRAIYVPFQTEQDAQKAIEENKVNVILDPENNASRDSNLVGAWLSAKNNIRFIVFNPLNSALANVAVRHALMCMILPARFTVLEAQGFVLRVNNYWLNPEAEISCADVSDSSLNYAVQLLKSAGYTWTQEPTKDTPGSGLSMPDAQPFPAIKILSLSKDKDSLEAEAANIIAEQVSQLGVSITVDEKSPQDIRYSVLSSKQYDMAILNWNLSLYPGYLCDWFGEQGQFYYGSDRIKSDCEALNVESDLAAAQKDAFDIQAVLAQDLPFIPLFTDVHYDAYRNVHYPFESVLGGLGGLYGAPSYAMP